jgi:hypothetical protein
MITAMTSAEYCSVMEPGDPLLVIDTVLPETGGTLVASGADIIILSMFGGAGHRTPSEFRALVESAGHLAVVETFSGGTSDIDGMMVTQVRKL